MKGGWRLYSSGPGICLANLIGNLCGIRFSPGGMELDPVLPKELDGLVIAMECFGEPKKFICRGAGDDGRLGRIRAEGVDIFAKERKNRYRKGGLWIEAGAVRGKEQIELCLEPEEYARAEGEVV